MKKIEVPLEVVILLVGGMALVITGFLIFVAGRGLIPYYPNGFHGLLLVIFALQTMMLGKTPFGDVRRSPVLIGIGAIIAAVGIVACFIPTFNRLPRVLLLICFGPGGLVLLLQMLLARDKLRTWARYGGTLWHLVIACTAVYCLSILLCVLLWRGDAIPPFLMAATVLVDGIMVFYLVGVLGKVYRLYPVSEKSQKNVVLSADGTMLLFTGIFMVILGLMLIPVALGFLPFSASAQIGLLMLIFAVQMLAAGSTPIGPFTRSWLMVVFGLIFAALGIISCIVPGILVLPLTILVGVLNILGGALALIRLLGTRLKAHRPRHAIPVVLTRLFAVQLVMNVLMIMFGVSMLVPGLVPGLIIGVILAANGGALLYLLYILLLLDKMQAGSEAVI